MRNETSHYDVRKSMFRALEGFFLERSLCARRCSRCCESIVATLYSECMIYPRCIALMQGGTFSSIDTFYQTTTTTTTKKTRTMLKSIWEQMILKILLYKAFKCIGTLQFGNQNYYLLHFWSTRGKILIILE